MKSIKTKVILSAAVLIFALVATIGSTYAWFTVSNTVSVSGVSMNVSTSESLLVKVDTGEAYNAATLLDAQNYKANLATDDVVYTGGLYENLGLWRLSPVTSQVGSVTGTTINAQDLQKMDIDTKVYSDATVGNDAAGYYIDLNFWVLSQGNDNEELILQDLVITAANTLGAQDAVVNAVKVAVWSSRVYGVAVDVPETAKVFGLDNDWGFVFTEGMRGYDGDTTDSIVAADKTALQALQSVYYNTGSGADATANVDTLTRASATTIATLTKNIPERITLRFYIEGWDGQCTNGILAAIFSVSFKFSLKATV